MTENKTILTAPFLPASVVAWRDVGETKFNPMPMEHEELDWLGGISAEDSPDGGGNPMGEGYFIYDRKLWIDPDGSEVLCPAVYFVRFAHCDPGGANDDGDVRDEGEIGAFLSWDDAAVAAGVHAWKRGLFLPASAQYANDKKAPYKTNTPGIVGLDKDETRYYFGDMGKNGRPKGHGFFATRRRMDGVKGENCWGLAVGYGKQHTHHFVVNHNQEDMFDYAMAGLVRRMLAESRKGAK